MSEIICQEARCNTCKALFSCIEKAKEHYRGNWHIFNSKRRANGLIPLTKEEFKRAAPLINNKPKKSNVVGPSTPSQTNSISNNEEIKEKIEILNELDLSNNNEDIEVNANSDSEVPEEEKDEVEIIELPLGPNISIFDNVKFDNVDDCVEYMALKFGFFIPDIEFLTDRDGLLSYLGEKVKRGGICLYCQRQLPPGRPCQSHMISKSHCKIAYEDGVDMEEFEDFFDFTSSYEDLPEEFDVNGDLVQHSLEVSSIGELILADGRIVGHRAFRKYYRQRLRVLDSRPSVIAHQREELLRLGSLHYGGTQVSQEEIALLTDVQVMGLLIRQQRDIRKSTIVEQRAQQRRQILDQRREYKSTVDKLRSSATTTAKIRDYHKTIM